MGGPYKLKKRGKPMTTIYDAAILLVDDNPDLLTLVTDNLRTAGYKTVCTAADCAAARAAFAAHRPDLMILDINLPDGDGFGLFRTLRTESDVPALFLSARDADADRLFGLGLGADDYLTKPFRPTVLLMRVKSLLRRVEMERGGDPTDRDITVGDLRFSGDEKQLFCREKPLALSPNELKMLLFLMRGEGKAFSRDELLNHIWGYNDEVETRVTDETLRRIRSKLSSADSKVQIETVWGYGYRLRSDGGGK